MRSAAYSPLDGLVDLACRDGVDVRPTLLRVLTDLYVQRPAHSAEEETQYVELALGLIETVDDATRKAVASRLAAYHAAPAAVVARLTHASPGKGAQKPSQAAAPAPAVSRDGTPPPTNEDLATIFFGASPEERRLILTHLDLASGPTASPLLPIARVTLEEIETAVFQRRHAEVIRLLHRALGIDQETATRIVQDESGEPMVVAAKTLGMTAPMLQRVLLFLNPAVGQSVRRVYDLADLFDTLSPAAAGRMLAIWRGTGTRAKSRSVTHSEPRVRPPAHAPVLHDDETQSARARATPGAQRIARPREDAPSRARDRR